MLALLTIFRGAASYELHGLIGAPGGLPTSLLAGIAAYLVPSSVSLWVRSDAVARGKRPPYDFDSLMFFLWVIAAPVYLFRTRGLRALGPLALCLLSFIGGELFAFLASSFATFGR